MHRKQEFYARCFVVEDDLGVDWSQTYVCPGHVASVFTMVMIIQWDWVYL